MTTTWTPNPVGIDRDEHHNYYVDGKGPLTSVTRIVRALDRSGPLVGWAKREVAACAVRNHDMVSQLIATGGKDQAASWLANIPDYQRDEAADLGSRVHVLADAIARGEDVHPTGVEVPYVRAYRKFLRAVNPQIVASEQMVANLSYGYGGTFDLAAYVDGVLTLLDIKTGKAVYAETALQLAGYASAEFTGSPGDATRHPLPAFLRYGVVHLQPDDWTLIPYDVNTETILAFRACIILNDWQRDLSRWTQGTPIKIASDDAQEGEVA